MSDKNRVGFRIGNGPGFWFTPKPDITAFELAACMEMLMAVASGTADTLARKWETVPGAAKRHFEEAKPAGE